MNATVSPCRLRGKATAPPSKSYAHRLLICAALANGQSRIYGIEDSEDILATKDCIASLGARAVYDGDALCITGGNVFSPTANHFACRESGSTLRFFLPLALVSGQSSVFCGAARLIERGIGVYQEILLPRDISLSVQDGCITASGALTSGDYVVRGNVSSQFLTGLLFALPLLAGDSTLTVTPPFESRAYVDLTLDAMAQFGVNITRDGDRFFIRGGQTYRPQDITVEGDWSNAAFLYALRTLGHEIEVSGLKSDSLQGDRVCLSYLEQLAHGHSTLDLSNCPDLAPVLFATAAALHGADFIGTARLAIKESDRAQVMATELAKFGAKVTVGENRVCVASSVLHAPREPLCGHGDHRVVMALAVLATRYGGVITQAEAVAKSYPQFWDVLSSLGAEVQLCN